MLTPSTAWTTKFDSANIDVDYYVKFELTPYGGGTATYELASNPRNSYAGPASVVKVSPIATELDIVNFEHKFSSVTIILKSDALTRTITSSTAFDKQRVTVKIGAPGLQPANYLPLGRYTVNNIETNDDGLIEVKCSDAGAIARVHHTYWTTPFTRNHPYVEMAAILQGSNIPTDTYDVSGLNPDTSTVGDSDAAHYCIGRSAELNGTLPEWLTASSKFDASVPVTKLLSQLSALMYGWFIYEEDGVYRFRNFDSTKAVSGHWTANDIITVKQPGTFDDTLNYITQDMIKCETADIGYAYRFGPSDADSINNHRWENKGGILQKNYNSDYLNGSCFVAGFNDLTFNKVENPSVGVPFSTINAQWGALESGTTGIYLNLTFAKHATCGGVKFKPGNTYVNNGLSATRKAYFVLTTYHSNLQQYKEIIACDEIRDDAISTGPLMSVRAGTAADESGPSNSIYRYRISDRALFGTPNNLWIPRANANPAVYGGSPNVVVGKIFAVDITIPLITGLEQLRRHMYGVPTVTVVTRPGLLKYQLNDHITLDYNGYINRNEIGCSSTGPVFQIVRKEANLDTTEPSIAWTLRWVKSTVAGSLPTASPGTTQFPEIQIPRPPNLDLLRRRSDGQYLYERSTQLGLNNRGG